MDLDDKLVCAAREGDREAFSRLIVQYQEMVYALCYRITGRRHDAEDLAHDAFVQAFVKLETLREPSRFVPWLRSMTLNLARMWYRRQRDEEPLVETAAGEMDAYDEAECARLLQSVGRLPAAYRMPVVLHYLEGMPCEDVAVFLGIAPGTVLSRLHRARRILKEDMIQSEDEEAIAMTGDARFEEEIDAEISLLLEAFEGDRQSADRLSAVLVHSPQRLARLIREPASAVTVTNLARLLPRLGRPGIAIVVRICVEGAEAALDVLETLVGRFQENRLNIGAPGMPDLTMYLIADELLAQSKDVARTVEVLIALMESTRHQASGMLLGEVVLSLGETGYSGLFQKLQQSSDPQEPYPLSNYVFQTLRNAGTWFLDDINAKLRQGRSEFWLAALDAFGAGICDYGQRDGRPAVPGPRFIGETDDATKVALVQLDQSSIDRGAEIAAGYLASPEAQLQRTALRVLDRLHAQEYAGQVADRLTDADSRVRIAAIYAMAGLGAHQVATRLLALAESQDAAERRAAVQAIGRLSPEGALEMLRTRLADSDPQVRGSAVIAMGELRLPELDQELKGLLKASDQVIRKAAATALYGMNRKAPVAASPGAPRYSTTCFSVPHAIRTRHISLDAAMRILPEMRVYSEPEVTQYIAQVCGDWSTIRRSLVDQRLLDREAGQYRFTDLGQAVWRVEHAIMDGWVQLGSGGLARV